MKDNKALNNSEVFNKDGIALKGFDVVSYFALGKAVAGTETLSLSWQGLQWYFSNESNREAFEKNPERYLPQYGGYCAYGASECYKASTNPTAFHIYQGRLYLNFAKYVQKRWLEKKDEKIKRANSNWDRIKNERIINANPIPIWWKYQFLKLFGKDLLE